MCNKCNNEGFVKEELLNGSRLVHPCPVCNKAESDRNRETRRQAAWLSRLSSADRPRAE
ncbi:hypothetical protein [Streptomyces huiliensis]|uniref:hypothetical protein n=1 Tax=Streptomyces huiliensis TaxID=2876027 RepID=UPI001CBB0A24|nr:hypothetical protein [Streptomyces huiliensis]MBZ4319890.1 hypothetical protein [Streptomyces huiliensis]